MKATGNTLRLYPKAGHKKMFLLMAVGSFSIATPSLVMLFSRFNGLSAVVALAMFAYSGLCFRIAYAQLMPGRLYLELNSEEFVERSPLATIRHRWQDAESFAAGFDDGRQVVAYRLVGSCRRWYHCWLAPAGGDGRLIQVYEVDPEPLSELMESWRRRCAEKSDPLHDLVDDAV